MKKYSVLVLIVFILGCNSNSKKKFEKLEELSWLQGNWENNLDEGRLVENWTKSNDSMYSGKSFYIQGKDTLHYETIELIQRNEDLFYIPIVKGQNNDEPIEFKLKTQAKTSFVFENKSHDYPQTIEYKKMSDNQLSATVSGSQDGKMSKEVYLLNRK